ARAHPVGCALAWSGRAETDSSARRLEPQHPTVGRVGEQVDEAVGSGADVTDAFAEALEKALLADRPAILEDHPGNELRPERAEEGATGPSREGVAAVDGEAGGRDGGAPVVGQPLHA